MPSVLSFPFTCTIVFGVQWPLTSQITFSLPSFLSSCSLYFTFHCRLTPPWVTEFTLVLIVYRVAMIRIQVNLMLNTNPAVSLFLSPLNKFLLWKLMISRPNMCWRWWYSALSCEIWRVSCTAKHSVGDILSLQTHLLYRHLLMTDMLPLQTPFYYGHLVIMDTLLLRTPSY